MRNALGFSWAKFAKLYKDYVNSRQPSAACKNCKWLQVMKSPISNDISHLTKIDITSSNIPAQDWYDLINQLMHYTVYTAFNMISQSTANYHY